MNLADELIQKVIDGELSKDDERELQGLIRSEPALARELENTLEIEHELRNLDDSFDVRHAVMAEVRRSLVMKPEPKKDPAKAIDAFFDRWFPKLAISATAVAAVVIAFVMIKGQPAEPAEIASFEGMVTVVRDGQGRSAGDFSHLQSGDQITVSKGSQFKLRYEDGTEVMIGSGTEIVFETEEAFDLASADSPSKRLELISGRIQADVTPQPEGQPLVFKTPHAYAIVRGTHFTLQSDRHRTRLDVTEGRVDLMRRTDGMVLSVGAGEFATAGGEETRQPPPEMPRSRDGLVAFYTFQEGADRTVRDRSGADDPLDLQIETPGKWKGSWLLNGGYELTNGTALFSQTAADRIVEACRETGALTIEAWVEPTRTIQGGPARIVTFSKGGENVNFMLGHGSSSGETGEVFVSRIRTSRVEPASVPSLEFEDRVDGSLEHLVITRSASGDLKFFRNGTLTSERQLEGDFTTWEEGLKLGLGNDPHDDRPWEGALYLVAIYSRALDPAEVAQNFKAGAKQKAGDQR